MDVKIEPRKQTDRGGYLMMPLLKNVPIAPRATWKLVKCPVCGASAGTGHIRKAGKNRRKCVQCVR